MVNFGNDTPFPRRGWALFLLGGSASGKTTFIEREHFPFRGRVLSADTLSDVVLRVHNHAEYYARRYPALFGEVEQMVRSGLNARNKYLSPHDGRRWPQNVRLTYDAKGPLECSMVSLLSNCVHGAGGRAAYFEGCIARMRPRSGNLIFDMTGDASSVRRYVARVREAGYRILLVWVVTNRNYSLLWNRGRHRRMKDSAVHFGHNVPNGFLPDYLTGEAGAEIDRAMLFFNSTESLRRGMTDEEWDVRRVELPKSDGRFVLSQEVKERLIKVLGKMEDNPLGNDGVVTDEPVFQTDARGCELVVDETFVARCTREVTTADGRTFRALCKMDCKGELVMQKDGVTPQLLRPERSDPNYPYIPIGKEDFGQKIFRRERGGGIRYRVKRTPRTYICPRSMNVMFSRLSQYNLLASQRGLSVVRMSELVDSFEAEQKTVFGKNMAGLYARLGMKEPPLPPLTREVCDVNPPCRGQFLSEEEFRMAADDFDGRRQRYEENCREWKAYEQKYTCNATV